MEACKGSNYQPSFMIDSLLTRKAIDQNGDFSTIPSPLGPAGRTRENGEAVHGSNRTTLSAADRRETCITRSNDHHTSERRSSCAKRESTSTSGGEDDEDGFRKRKKPRTAFSREQVAELEKKFQEKKYLSSAERGELAEKLKLSDMQVKTWFQNRRMKFKRQTEEAEMEMKSPKYPAYHSFVPYSSFYPGYMAYKPDNVVHYPYPTLRSPPTPSGSSDSNFSPMSLTSPTHFSSLHSPLPRPGHSPHTPSTTYFPNAGILPITPPSTSPYHHNQHHHHSYFTTDTNVSNSHTPQVAATGGTSIATQNVVQNVQHLQFTAMTEWPRPLP